eukprot:403346153
MKKNKNLKMLKSKIRSIDMYGQPFQLTFKGEKTFKTMIGAVITMMVLVSMISYIGFKLNIMFNRSDIKTSRLVMNDAQSDDPSITNVYDLGFDIAFGKIGGYDSKYADLSVNHMTKIKTTDAKTGLPVEEFNIENLKMTTCGDENFNYDKKNESAYADVRGLQCIEDKTKMNLGGAWTTNRLEMINICLAACTNSSANGNKCGSSAQIKEYFKLEDFQLRFASQYFDFNDQVTPIKKFIEDRFFLPVQTSQKKAMNVFARKSTVTLNDGIIPFFQSEEDVEFVKVDNIKPYSAEVGYGFDSCYILISLRMDFEGELMTRDVYTFTDLLSDMGGIYSSLFAFGAIIVGIFSETLFYKQMIKDIYQARPSKRGLTESMKNSYGIFIDRKNNKSAIKKKETFGFNNRTSSLIDKFTLKNTQHQSINVQHLENSQSSYQQTQQNNNPKSKKNFLNSANAIHEKSPKFDYSQDTFSQMQDSTRGMKMSSPLDSTVSIRPMGNTPQIKIIREENETDSSKNDNTFTKKNIIQTKDQSLINNIIHQILNRVNFKIKFVDLMRTIFQKFIGEKKIRENLKYRSVYLYNKGVQKIDNEFDAISLIKLMKQVKLLTSTLLNPTQKMMLGFQKQNVLDSDSSDNDSEEDDVALVKKLRSQNKFIRLMALGRVKHNIQGYFNQERKFKEIDHKLVKGIINHYEGEAQLKLKGFSKIKQKINEIKEERVASASGAGNRQKKRLLNLLSNDMYEVIDKHKDTQPIKNDDNQILSQNLDDLLLDQEKFRPKKQITPLDWDIERGIENMQIQKPQTQKQNRYNLNESLDGLISISKLDFKN